MLHWDIWKYTTEFTRKNGLINANSVPRLTLNLSVWKYIWRRTRMKSFVINARGDLKVMKRWKDTIVKTYDLQKRTLMMMWLVVQLQKNCKCWVFNWKFVWFEIIVLFFHFILFYHYDIILLLLYSFIIIISFYHYYFIIMLVVRVVE